MSKKWNPNKLPTGWKVDEDQANRKPETISSTQIIARKKRNNILEKILKWIIYGIIFIAIPKFIKSSKTKGKEIVNSAYEKINSNEFSFVPAGYAMYLFLSFIPISILMLGIIGSVDEKYEVVLKNVILGQIIPGISEVIPSFSTLWGSTGNAIALILFALSVLILASKGYSKFIFSIDALYEHKSPFRVWKSRIKGFIVSVFVCLILSLILLGLTAFMVFLIDKVGLGKFDADIKKMKLADFNLTTEFYLIYWFTTILFLPVFTYLGFLFYFVYAPNFKLKMSQAHPGALIAAIPTAIFILIFGSLTSLIPYKKFGIVASFMYIILLLSFTSYFIYMGIIVNSSFYKTFINLPTVEKHSFWKKQKISI